MKKTIHTPLSPLLFCLLACTHLASCTLEGSDNGELDGFWHMRSVDTLATGGVADLSQQRLFWAVQGTLLDMRDADKRYEQCISHFRQAGDSLFLLDSYLFNRVEGDHAIEEPTPLAPYGVSCMGEHFLISRLGGGRMVLCSSHYQLTFRRL